MKIGMSRKKHLEIEKAEELKKAEIAATADIRAKRNLPEPRSFGGSFRIGFYRQSTTEQIVLRTLNLAAMNRKVSFDYERKADDRFEVYMEGALLCHKSFDDMERLLQDSLKAYESFWDKIIDQALSTDAP